MKIVGISGSPRAKGNTEILAKGTPQDRPDVPGGPEFLLKNKVGGAIAVGGGRDGGQLFTVNSILQWMLMQNMIVVGNNYGMGG